MEDKQPRWIERLSVFRNAIVRMAEVIAITKQRPLNQFERDSLIKRFEFTYEMAWKLMMSPSPHNILSLVSSAHQSSCDFWTETQNSDSLQTMIGYR